ncbi:MULTISPECIES: TetR/AcrR family transcriptional regulator [Nonomuraea]|uniref:TetR/AcrR family transcriptional regulator n=1 Tax=Nonomuraea ferruginea TaxID=46174 RepID=A0ABT4SV10_9ACTN|nr:TetR/AcrR family transcriptional regulator [Nonomuraea ferruginea]MDA0641002.1 TetR/AcrR family transcriptional regulator [Nonomuraea ferruginea]
MGRLSADDWAEAALAALAEGGVAAVAVEPVAARLGVSKGSFYWHFANRRALLEAALRRWEAQTERVIARLEDVADPLERMRVLLERAFGEGRDAAIAFRLISEADDPLVGEVARQVSERRLAYMEGVLRELGLPRQEARRRVLAAYGGYLGVAALVRIGTIREMPDDLAGLAMAELGLTGNDPSGPP